MNHPFTKLDVALSRPGCYSVHMPTRGSYHGNRLEDAEWLWDWYSKSGAIQPTLWREVGEAKGGFEFIR